MSATHDNPRYVKHDRGADIEQAVQEIGHIMEALLKLRQRAESSTPEQMGQSAIGIRSLCRDVQFTLGYLPLDVSERMTDDAR